MKLRSVGERARQTLCFEVGGITLVTPLYVYITGSTLSTGTFLLATISVAIMIWSPIHNSLFDVVDLRLSRRVASERTQVMRVVQALSHEITAIAISFPLMIWLGGLSVREALSANFVLTIFYAAYTYAFHIVFDRLRPVQIPLKVGGYENDARPISTKCGAK